MFLFETKVKSKQKSRYPGYPFVFEGKSKRAVGFKPRIARLLNPFPFDVRRNDEHVVVFLAIANRKGEGEDFAEEFGFSGKRF